MSTDDNNSSPEPELDNENLDYDNSYKAWTTVVRDRCTRTANLFDIQQELIQNKKPTITRDDIAEALDKRNLLRQTKVTQFSSNIKYISIEFDTSMIMKAFCSNPLLVREQFSITFLPGFRKKQCLFYELECITSQNVPSKADGEAMIVYFQQYATVVGRSRYPIKKLGEIEYLTGTQVHRVHSRKQHLPRLINLSGRQIKCMYTKQPEY